MGSSLGFVGAPLAARRLKGRVYRSARRAIERARAVEVRLFRARLRSEGNGIMIEISREIFPTLFSPEVRLVGADFTAERNWNCPFEAVWLEAAFSNRGRRAFDEECEAQFACRHV